MNASSDLRTRLDRLIAADPSLPTIDGGARERLVAFVQLLARWNRVWNLTAVRDAETMLERHVLDSLSLLPFIDGVPRHVDMADAPDVPDLLDIGSGAGLPVLPLAIARPGLACVSVERTGKKARFQRQAVLELGLDGVRVRAERIEDVVQRASVVTSRAFTEPGAFLRLAAMHVVPGGRALVMLGRAERLPERLPAPFELDRLHRVNGRHERHVAVCIARA